MLYIHDCKYTCHYMEEGEGYAENFFQSCGELRELDGDFFSFKVSKSFWFNAHSLKRSIITKLSADDNSSMKAAYVR